jgi:hypothetical protein
MAITGPPIQWTKNYVQIMIYNALKIQVARRCRLGPPVWRILVKLASAIAGQPIETITTGPFFFLRAHFLSLKVAAWRFVASHSLISAGSNLTSPSSFK